MDYPEPQSIPERVGGRLAVVIALELTLLLGGTYGAWQVARGQGLGIKAKESRGAQEEDLRMPPPLAFIDDDPPIAAKERLAVHFETRADFALHLTKGDDEQQAVIGKLSAGSRTSVHSTARRSCSQGRALARRAASRRPRYSDERRWIHVWEYPNKIRVTQDVMLINNNDTPKLDSVLVRYLVENRGEELPHGWPALSARHADGQHGRRAVRGAGAAPC